MAELAGAYRGLIDDLFHRRRTDRVERYVTGDYQVTDGFQPGRGGGLDGLRAYGEGVVAGLDEVRYDLIDTVEQPDRLVVRYVVTARAGGRRIVAHGMSMHHGRGGKLAASWNLADLRDLGRHPDGEPAAELVAAWRADGAVGRGPHATRYAAIVHALYDDGRAIEDAFDPEYLAWDPFVPRRGGGRAEGQHLAVRRAVDSARYEVIETVEDRDRLGVRYLVTVERGGERSHHLGLSINHLRDGRLRCGAILCRHGRCAALLQEGGA